jgi:hypothetical protein
MFDVEVDADGHVLDAVRVGDFGGVKDLGWNETEHQNLAAETSNLIGAISEQWTASAAAGLFYLGWHNDTLSRDWMNYFLKERLNSTALVDATKPVPDPDFAIPHVSEIYRRLFSSLIGLDFTIFRPRSEPVPLEGTLTAPETRIFVDDVAFIITITILVLNVIVTTTLYVQEREAFLPRLPSTIGSMAAYVAASRAVRQYQRPTKDQRDQTGNGEATALEPTYTFGKYFGVDGRWHVGIEADPFVKPLILSDLKRRDSWFGGVLSRGSWLRRRRVSGKSWSI